MNQMTQAVDRVAEIEQASERARVLDPLLNVFARTTYTEALEAAKQADPGAPLADITLGVKDVIFESSGPTSAGSRVALAAWPDEQPEAAVVSRLKSAGAVVVGKTTTMEYALGMPDPGTGQLPSRNPWDPDRWAGGSSSGAGSGVISGLFNAAVATDTTGSLRIPAAYTGATAVKPTRGLLPTTGIYPLAPSLDNVGPLARSVVDAARLLDAMASAATDSNGRTDFTAATRRPVEALRVGVDRLERAADAGIDSAQPAVFDSALAALQSAGLVLTEFDIPAYQELNVIGNVLMLAEAHEIHADAMAQSPSGYGYGARVAFSAGAEISSLDYLRAQRLRNHLTAQIESLFDRFDLIVTPTCHLGAPLLSGIEPADPSTYLGSMHTTAWSVTGHPVVVLPIGLSADGLPLSMSIITRHWDDARAISVAAEYQRRTQHHLGVPDVVEGM